MGGGGKRSNNAYLYKRRQDTADLPYEVLACFILVPWSILLALKLL